MNGRVLLDTNVLVYIYDPLDSAKQERAIAYGRALPIAVVDQLIRPRSDRVVALKCTV